MNVSAHRAFSFLRTYGYERVSCSKEERTVAEALLNECKSLGVSAQLEEFTVPCGRVSHALLRVTSPYVKEYEVTGYERAASTPEGGLDAEFLYVENADEVLLEQAKGKIVLVNGYLNRATYEKLRKAEAAAILTFTGRTIDRESESDLNRCKLRETLTEPFGAIPVLNMRAASAAERTEYLDQMEQQIRTYEAQNKTGNRVLDTILTAKTIQCQSEGISLTCVADGQALDFMNPMDISALFGNALDNAIESVKKLPNPEQRLIHVSAMRQKDFLRIRVENCYSGELRFVDGMPTTTKRDARYHGYGLKSIQSIAHSYGGSATIDTKDGWFELRLLLPVPKEKKGEAAEKRDERTKA